jgi:integrase
MARRSAGEGTIFYNDKLARWQAQLTLPTGKKKTKTTKTQGEAKRWLLDQRKAIEDNTYISAKDITLEVYLSRYMEEVVNHSLAPKTISSYQYIIEKHILTDLGKIKLTQLRADHLQKLYSDKLNSGLSKRTVLYFHQILHKALEHAVKMGLVARNVTDMADHPTIRRTAPETLSVAQVKELLDSLQNDRLYPLYLLAVSTGMREGELLGLHWEDVNLETGVITVRHQAQEIPGQGMIIKEPKTETSKRPIELPTKALDCLRQLDRSSSHVGLVFKTSNNTPFSQRNLIRHFHQSLKKADLPWVKFHSLRHFTATSLLQRGVHPKLVQSLLGHSTIGLTLDTYSHVIPGINREATEKMNDILG